MRASMNRPKRASRAGRTAAAGAAVAVAGLLALAGCGSSSKTASTSGAQAGAAPTTAAASASGSATTAASGSTIATGNTTLGVLVVDASGRTLYMFDKDTAGSNTSACAGSCATTWPAASVTGTPTEASGITGTVGVIMRADGTQQVTLNGHPLYRFSGDQAPGDTHGNGIGGIWHAVLASGSPAPASTAAPAAPTTTTGGGYGY
jgi:predicted lipoprotein with Yx(FWY)xxD motif